LHIEAEMDAEEDALIRTLVSRRTDTTARLVYADWLEERDHRGAAYLRAEVALAQATATDAPRLRRELLDTIPPLPTAWRDRFEQPDLLLAPPVPIRTGWYSMGASAPSEYRKLPNIEPEGLSPELPWLDGDDVEPWQDQAAVERHELAVLEGVKRRAATLSLTFPPGFEALARDFPRRRAILEESSYEFVLDYPIRCSVPQDGKGYVLPFYGDSNYGNVVQQSWSLYLVPEVNWHCVVACPLGENAESGLPDDPNDIVYCAPSFHAFLYRWWRECGAR
jgi:uncharacterized protein (TIGR02996 family)